MITWDDIRAQKDAILSAEIDAQGQYERCDLDIDSIREGFRQEEIDPMKGMPAAFREAILGTADEELEAVFIHGLTMGLELAGRNA